jgi:hypothetical protein
MADARCPPARAVRGPTVGLPLYHPCIDTYQGQG